MSDPWGSFGQIYIWLHVGWMVPALIGLYWTQALRGRRGPAQTLRSVYHLAYLADGPNRVTDTVVVSMIEHVQLRVDSTGKLYPTPTRPVHSLEREVAALTMSAGSDTAFGLRAPLRRSAPMAELVDELSAQGLVVAASKREAVWRTVSALYVALFLLDLARVITFAALDRALVINAASAGGMLLFSAGAFAFSTKHPRSARATAAGITSLRATGHDLSLASPSTLAVAHGGLAFYPDRALAEALLLPRIAAEQRHQDLAPEES